jgi:hypothetical protein
LRTGLVVAVAATLLAAVPHEVRAAQRHAVAAPAASAWSWSGIVERIEAQLRPVLGWVAGGGQSGGGRAPAGAASTDTFPTTDPNGSSSGASSDTYSTTDPNG